MVPKIKIQGQLYRLLSFRRVKRGEILYNSMVEGVEMTPNKEGFMGAKILVVDDEAPIVDVLVYNLEKAHYDVSVARDGAEALAVARRVQPDLIVLDIMLPHLDGLEVCRILRHEQDVAIIMLTARDTEIDRVVGLELGADDYVVKPFSVRELLARVKNVLRRTSNQTQTSEATRLCIGPLVVDDTSHEAKVGVVQLDLTLLEFDTLKMLAQHVGQVLKREQLLAEVWGYDFDGDSRVVDAVIKRLRAKLREAAPDSEMIVTVRGVGYKLLKPE